MRLGTRLTIFALAALGALAMLALPAIAAAKDRNHDRIPDRWEMRNHLSLRVNQASRDQDGDHLRNRAEFLAGDNPRRADSDGDGIPDGAENAGTIQSFDAATGRLTIAVFGGEPISGMVTEETEIECSHEGATASDSHEGGEEGGNEHEGGPGEHHGEEPGDDDGEEPGDGGGEHSGPGDEEDPACTVADLVPGATVHEAELKLGGSGAVFEKVELGG
ncbi:MAG TPA: hypothetical protein VHU14_02690 [Solirubrobacterales bacterium]|jgi:hypothetical protein|nr:hypothetical protein [Solirubrobacterales bacterium]